MALPFAGPLAKPRPRPLPRLGFAGSYLLLLNSFFLFQSGCGCFEKNCSFWGGPLKHCLEASGGPLKVLKKSLTGLLKCFQRPLRPLQGPSKVFQNALNQRQQHEPWREGPRCNVPAQPRTHTHAPVVAAKYLFYETGDRLRQPGDQKCIP